MRPPSKLIIAALPALLLAGCQTWGPTWSEVSGNRFTRTTLDRGPVTVDSVDGSSTFVNNQRTPVRIEPGKRTLAITGVPLQPGFRGTQQTFVLDAEPCKRYYVNAQWSNRLGTSGWDPVIDFVEAIAGCRLPGAK